MYIYVCICVYIYVYICIYNADNNVVSNTATTNTLLEEAGKFFKSKKDVDEKVLKNQFQDILTGKKHYHPSLLKELYADLESPSGSVKETIKFPSIKGYDTTYGFSYSSTSDCMDKMIYGN